MSAELTPATPAVTVPAGIGNVPASPLFSTLQVSYGALQVLDVVSTLRGVGNGHVEANPLMRGATAHPVAFTAVKAAAGVSTLLLARRVASRNRVAAIVMMAAINSGYAVIVARNFQTGGPR